MIFLWLLYLSQDGIIFYQRKTGNVLLEWKWFQSHFIWELCRPYWSNNLQTCHLSFPVYFGFMVRLWYVLINVAYAMMLAFSPCNLQRNTLSKLLWPTLQWTQYQSVSHFFTISSSSFCNIPQRLSLRGLSVQKSIKLSARKSFQLESPFCQKAYIIKPEEPAQCSSWVDCT